MTLGARSTPPPRVTVEARANARPAAPPALDRDRVAIMKLELRLPHDVWLAKFTLQHPELVVETMNLLQVADRNIITEMEIYGPPVDWTDEIAASPDVLEVERLSMKPEMGRYRVRFHQTLLVQLARELEVMIRYPRTAQNGRLMCETIGRLSRLRQLITTLRALGVEASITSLRAESLRSVRLTLTSAQRSLFRQALALGYFCVPRRISLTRLAERVSRSKSSVSEMLAVVERKLAHSASAMGA
jgi:predicted DNA binding protein